MSEANRALVERYFHELFNRGRLDLVDSLLHPEYVNHSPGPGVPPGRDGVKLVVTALREAFPDLHYRIEDLVVAPDAVAARTTMTGTHAGPLFGLPATGRAVRVSQFTIERIADGPWPTTASPTSWPCGSSLGCSDRPGSSVRRNRAMVRSL